MILKNVKTSWAYISEPDENGNFRVTFEVNEEQDKVLKKVLTDCLKEKGKDPNKADWLGSRKDASENEEGVTTYSCKCAKVFTTKSGQEKTRELPVYDKHARRLNPEDIPNIRNGAICNVDVDVYFASYMKKYGAMLSFRGLQLISYEEFSPECKFEAVDEDEGGENRGFKNESKDNDDEYNEDIF